MEWRKSVSARKNRTPVSPQRPCDVHARSEVILVDSEANSTSGSSKSAECVSATRADHSDELDNEWC